MLKEIEERLNKIVNEKYQIDYIGKVPLRTREDVKILVWNSFHISSPDCELMAGLFIRENRVKIKYLYRENGWNLKILDSDVITEFDLRKLNLSDIENYIDDDDGFFLYYG